MSSILRNPFPFALHPSPNPSRGPNSSLSLRPPRATADSDEPPPKPDVEGGNKDGGFENRLTKVRVKYRSGTGKKAEQRRARKYGGGEGKKGKGVMLPPVALREAVTVDGEKVEIGFTPYCERINGRIAGIGLAALVLVEIGSGKGVLSYHAPPVIFIQIYTVVAVGALYIKFEKERISVWPEKSESSSASSASSGD